MSTGFKLSRFLGVFLLAIGTLCPSRMIAAQSSQNQKKTKKPQQQQQMDSLPSGPTGKPVQPMPLDSIAPVPPQVSYQNSQLTIVAPNSTLADILRAVRKQTGAEIEVPAAPERVVTHLGPGPAREVVAELLNGSRFNYVLLGSPGDQTVLTRVVLVAKTAAETASATSPTEQAQATPNSPGMIPPQGNLAAPQEMPADANDAETTEDAPDDANAEQPPADAEQPPANSEQPGVKTPQQLLQEMQQRQLQLQQQQPGGQPPAPGVPPRAAQEQ
jgi:hypothetical protein